MREAGLTLGIISKSSEATIRTSLKEAGLTELFNGPLVTNAVGFEGKVGFIEDLVRGEALGFLGPDGLRKVLLVDDDVRELERARARGVQVFAAPEDGGLQESHFEELFLGLGLEASGLPTPPPTRSSVDRSSCVSAMPTTTSASSTTMTWISPQPTPCGTHATQSTPSPRQQLPVLTTEQDLDDREGGVESEETTPLWLEDTSDEEGDMSTPRRPKTCLASSRASKLLFSRTSELGTAAELDQALADC
jgi:hypothetical protein